MAGGQGRGRIGLVFEDWPEADKAAWLFAIADGDVFDGRGPAAHWAPATCKTNINKYGRFLGYLRQIGRLLVTCRPGDRVTLEIVKGYICYLRSTKVAPRTVVSYLVGLKVMIKAMSPETDWRWLADICNALNRSSDPLTDKDSRVRPSEEIYEVALAELDRLQGLPLRGRNRLCAYRNTLMIAFLAARPLRRKNLTALEPGGDLIQTEPGWLIAIPGKEVKNAQPLEFDLPEFFVPYLEAYLRDVRPKILGNAGPSDRLWVGWKKSSVSSHGVYFCITRQSKRLLGAPLNPHLFRDCAATSLSLVSTAAARAAAPLLGHRYFDTTQRYYVTARRLEASRKLNAVLSSIKRSAG